MLRPGDLPLGPERACFGLVQRKITVDVLNSDAIDFSGFPQAYVTVANIVEDALGVALDRIAQAAAARHFQPERFARMKHVVGVARGNYPFVRTAGIQNAVA